jgi:hypothetical protein
LQSLCVGKSNVPLVQCQRPDIQYDSSEENLNLHSYEVPPRKDRRGVDLVSDALPFGRVWYGEPDAISNAIGYAKFFSRSHDPVIRVYDEAGQRN